MTLSIIIPTFNTRQITINCLKTIYKYPLKESFEIIVVDNASSDNTAQKVAKMFPKVHLFKNNRNLGYSKANNLGLRQSRGKYILLLNSDTMVTKNSLQKTIDYFNNNKNISALTAKLINPDGSPQYYYHRRFPSLLTLIASFLENYLEISTPISKKYFMRDEKFVKEIQIDQAAGTFFAIRKDKIKKLGGLFDDNLPLYFNDTDLCLRIRKQGLKLILNPGIEVIHLRGKTTDLISPYMVREEMLISMLYFFRKHRQFLNYLLVKISLTLLLFVFILGSAIRVFNSYLGTKIKDRNKSIKNQLKILLSVIIEKPKISYFIR